MTQIALQTARAASENDFRLTPAQDRAMDVLVSDATHIALGGGSRSGKTLLLLRAVLIRALREPKSRHVIFRFTFNSIKASIIYDTLPKLIDLCFPELKPIALNRTDWFLTLPNGSEVWFGGLDDKERTEKILGQEFCVDPEAKVLTADLRWVPAKDVQIGDDLIAFPENLDGHQILERSKVLRKTVQRAERYRIITTKGETIVSAKHKFVWYGDDRRDKQFRYLSWKAAEDLMPGDCIRYATDPWEPIETYESGWLAGMYDGEGWVGPGSLGLSQNASPTLDKMLGLVKRYGFKYVVRAYENKYKHKISKNKKHSCSQIVTSGMWDAMEVIGTLRPFRLLSKSHTLWEGRRGFIARGNSSGYGTGRKVDVTGRHVAEVIAIEPLGRGDVIAFGTSTKTLIADGFLGHNCTIYFNECSQIPYNSIQIALSRLAQKTRTLRLKAYYDFNPPSKRHHTYLTFVEKKNPLTKLPLPHPENYGFYLINPADNKENLAPEYLALLEAMPVKQRDRFLLGKFADDSDGALWTPELLEHNRRLGEHEIPDFIRVIISVDPSGCRGEEDFRSDEIGIVVGALGRDSHVYVLEDLSGRYSPEQWGNVVANAFIRHKADAVIGEKNFGGDMVRAIIHAQDASIPYREVSASRGKVQRAEPVAHLYEQNKVHHVGQFFELEDQLMNFMQSGYVGLKSPDRADACIWLVSELYPAVTRKEQTNVIQSKVITRKRSSSRLARGTR